MLGAPSRSPFRDGPVPPGDAPTPWRRGATRPEPRGQRPRPRKAGFPQGQYSPLAADFRWLLLLQQAPRDHHSLHLARAFVDRGHPHVAVQARDLIVLVEAVAAVELKALGAGAVGGFRSVDLGLGGQAAGVL